MLRWWTTYEQTLLTKLIRFPLSTTPRERMLMLSAIRLVALSLALLIFGMLSISMGAILNWTALVMGGAVTFIAGLVLLVLTMALNAILIIVYGD